MATYNGTFLPDIYVGTASADTINGFGGIDILSGAGGNDVIHGGTGLDTLDGGDGDDQVFGDEGDDVLSGGSGNDVLDGGPGEATLLSLYNGGEGNDLLIASGAGIEDFDGGDGIDTLSLINRGSGVRVVLGGIDLILLDAVRNVENVIGSNYADDILGDDNNNTLSGGMGDDTLTGAGGNDVLDGGTGGDQMAGGMGDDTYYVDDADDVIVELDGEGNDTVYSSGDFDLANAGSIEQVSLVGSGNVSLSGNDENNRLTGNSGDNTLEGRGGDDRLNGGAGADRMVGDTGDDIYFVDDAGDQVVENPDEGNDTVYSSISYTLDGGEVENLVLTGGGAINATGNQHANTLTGNGAANVLDGRGGADVMMGGNGDDIYYVDDYADRVVEGFNQGYDIVYSTVSFAITGQYIELLELIGTGDAGARGNGQDNVIVGNSGANRLNGDLGADSMTGHESNDRYVVDNVGDVVVEAANEGYDGVESSISYTLGDHVEVLYLTGVDIINGTGNALDNEIYGNSKANVIDGGAGVDRMWGGNGNDYYYVNTVGDRAFENANEGYDIVESSISYNIQGQYIEELRLVGSNAANSVGNTLNNVMWGNDGANAFRGEAGNDSLHGGLGRDTLTGGEGQDGFFFDTALSATTNVDRILDFVRADDTIYLDDAVFTGLETGTLAASELRFGTAAQDADDHIIYDANTGRIWFDADGNGEGGQILFAQLASGTAVTNADFVII